MNSYIFTLQGYMLFASTTQWSPYTGRAFGEDGVAPPAAGD